MKRFGTVRLLWLLHLFVNSVLALVDLRITRINGAWRNPTEAIKGALFRSSVNGVIHIGAHVGQEAQNYADLRLPVIWIEADPILYEQLFRRIKNYREQRAFLGLVGDSVQEVDFYRTSNDGQSSSILTLNPSHPFGDLAVTESIRLKQTTLNLLLQDVKIDNFNYWVIDVQGAELSVLRGSGETLQFCDFVEVEVSTFEHYLDQPLFDEVFIFLKKHDFEPVFRPPKYFHGNILFIRSRNMSAPVI